MTIDVLTFEEAIEDSNPREGGRSVLLGNGFSIDWDHRIFNYRSLYEEADFQGLSTTKKELFEVLESHDFEYIIEHLNTAAKLVELHENCGTVGRTLKDDAKVVKHGLANVIAKRHPRNNNELTQEDSERARRFLSEFGRIFSLNYDLLLYWTLNRKESKFQVQCGDGFEWPTAEESPELIWKSSAAERGQRVFHLHGALHLFVTPERKLRKLRYSNSKDLISQALSRLENGKYPLIVTEGTSVEKLATIERSSYLRYCHGKLENADGSLFIHGASLSRNDDHVLKLIEGKKSKIEAVYVSVYGDADDVENHQLTQRARFLKKNREKNGGARLDVKFYDSESAHVWHP